MPIQLLIVALIVHLPALGSVPAQHVDPSARPQQKHEQQEQVTSEQLQPAAEPDPEQPEQEFPWPVRLGLRVLQVERAFPLIDRVVLVPDAATYVDELGKWSPHGRWPVLIDDDYFTPMFIRRFRPAQVIRRPSVGQQPITQQTITNLTITSFGGNPQAHSLRDVFNAHNYAPPGAVIASLNDPAWTAAAALAAGRGQPLIWISQPFGTPNDVLEQPQADELRQRIEDELSALGWSFDALGDEIDALTICRAIAGRVNLPRPDTGEIEPAAITDYLGRHPHPNHERYAIVSWIFGDEIRSAYMAMCALYLPRTSITMINTYGWRDEEDWDYFDMTGPTAILAEHGFDVTHYAGRLRTSETAWLGMIASGMQADVIAMNSRGSPYYFDLYQGRGWPPDVPILNTPAALHLIHSWSLRSPESFDTVGGRWLSRGVYAYVGSVHEPFLSAFQTPTMLAKRWISMVPFHVSARYWEQYAMPFSWPWKINTIGDPLMLMAPPLEHRKDRIDQPADYGQDLHDLAEQLLRQVRNDPTPHVLSRAIALLDLLGRDDVALPLWKLAQELGEQHEQDAAAAALRPLFRARDIDSFKSAWLSLEHHDDQQLDMLWHLLVPQLRMLSRNDLLLLQSAIRPHDPYVDIRRLGPFLANTFGNQHVRDLIQQHIQQPLTDYHRNQLETLLQQYQD